MLEGGGDWVRDRERTLNDRGKGENVAAPFLSPLILKVIGKGNETK